MEQSRRIKLAAELEKQGARVKQTRSGYMVFTPLGTIAWHKSGSGSFNAEHNIRADVQRVGLVWPFKKKGK